MDPHAQKEIRVYAQAMYNLIEPIVPVTMQAFDDYLLNSIKLTGPEIRAIADRSFLCSDNKREQAEFEAKLELLNLNIAECP